MKQYHILNGDALKEQLYNQLDGEVIVMRECLVDGPVKANSLKEFLQVRAEFISENYGGKPDDYHMNSSTEINKMLEIEEPAEINLWFEDDLFCQVNFWFIANLFHEQNKPNLKYFLVRPEKFDQYGFGGLDQTALMDIYANRTELIGLETLSKLWNAYQKNDIDQLTNTAEALSRRFPFILPAVNAHIQRLPVNGNPGRPVMSLMNIIEELDTQEFGPVFKEFCKREPIYGFGDLQVKRLYDKILSDH